jgi:hypothetical protein
METKLMNRRILRQPAATVETLATRPDRSLVAIILPVVDKMLAIDPANSLSLDKALEADEVDIAEPIISRCLLTPPATEETAETMPASIAFAAVEIAPVIDDMPATSPMNRLRRFITPWTKETPATAPINF